MKIVPLFVLFLMPSAGSAQGMHVHHAFQNVCEGYMYYDEFADSVVWSTGDVGFSLYDLAPGFYGFEVYQNGQIVNQGTREVELVGWNFTSFGGDPYIFPGLVMITGTLDVPHCVGQIFTGVCCMPDSADTPLLVFQDGVPYPFTEVSLFDLDQPGECNGCTQVLCTYASFRFLAPPGHVYTVGVNDTACAGLVMSDTSITTPSCANLELVTQVVNASSGQADGAITLVQAIPDPNEPYPIQAPVTGTASLHQLPDGVNMGTFENVASAYWEGLSLGEYLLSFIPDAGCQSHSVTLEVGTGTTIEEQGRSSGVRAFPTADGRSIYLITDREGPVHVRIMDVNGRVVLQHQFTVGAVPIDDLAPGAYFVQAEQGGVTYRTRFNKQ